MKQAYDFLKESQLLLELLQSKKETDFDLITQFKGWSINDVIGHLYLFNVAAIKTIDGSRAFDDFFNPFSVLLKEGKSMVEAQVSWLDSLSGHSLLTKWWESCLILEKLYSKVDPKLRIKWVGPEMSARSCITARQMETWSHGHEVFDCMGQIRNEGDHINNIVHLGVSTFNWTFINRNIPVPNIQPFILVSLPSGLELSYNEKNNNYYVKGSAVEFCQVVTQVRNIDDTALSISGDPVLTWMKYAQCFAGKPEDPPKKGERKIQK